MKEYALLTMHYEYAIVLQYFQYDYQSGKSIETVLYSLVHKIEHVISQKDIANRASNVKNGCVKHDAPAHKNYHFDKML